MASFANVGLTLLIGAVALFFIGTQAKKANGGFISFGEAFKTIFFSFAMGALLFSLFNFLLNTVIDPDLPMRIYEATISNSMEMMENMGMQGDQLEKVYEEFEKKKDDIANQYNFLGFMQSYLVSLVFGAVLILIVSLIVKKDNPNPFNNVMDN